MQRKIHNQTLFVAALSVYLGLVLVGASPHVLAQVSTKFAERNKISIVAPGEGCVFTFDLNPLIKLNSLSGDEPLPIKVSGKLIPLQQEVTNWQITAVGNQKIVEFLQKEFFQSAKLNPPTQPVIAKELNYSIVIDRNSITIIRSVKFNDSKKAEKMASMFNYMVEYAKNPDSPNKEVVGNLYLINTQTSFENDQVTIVTRLPRAGLDALLKANEKAN